MDAPTFSLIPAQVMAVGTDGTCQIAVALGGHSQSVGHLIVAGNPQSGLHWMPLALDWVLVAYQPGGVPLIVAPLSEKSLARAITPPLAPGEVRVAGPLAITGVLTVQGHGVVATDGVIGAGAPSAATHFLRVTLDGGLTWFKCALSPDP